MSIRDRSPQSFPAWMLVKRGRAQSRRVMCSAALLLVIVQASPSASAGSGWLDSPRLEAGFTVLQWSPIAQYSGSAPTVGASLTLTPHAGVMVEAGHWQAEGELDNSFWEPVPIRIADTWFSVAPRVESRLPGSTRAYVAAGIAAHWASDTVIPGQGWSTGPGSYYARHTFQPIVLAGLESPDIHGVRFGMAYRYLRAEEGWSGELKGHALGLSVRYDFGAATR